jgi:hypothetical protein
MTDSQHKQGKRMPYIGPELVRNLGAAIYRRMDLW